MLSRIGLCLAAYAIVVALAVNDVHADSVVACKTRCEVGGGKCRAPKQSMLDGCAALYDCAKPSCQHDSECAFGCARCNGVWSYQLDDCDRKRDECSERCDKVDTAP